MINKKSIWFLTLFSLILVLSVYYITMPSELLLSTNNDYTEEKPTVEITESTVLASLRVEADEEMMQELDELKLILTNEESTIEEKNNALNKMKDLNIKRGEEEKIENKILEKFNLQAFVKMKDNQIEIVINSSNHDRELANNIMRSVQEEYESQKYISVKFSNWFGLFPSLIYLFIIK